MPRILLIVDDRLDVAKCLKRVLKLGFDKIYVAQDPVEAETYLSNNEAPPTHVLCDYYLNPGEPLGTELIQQWRKLFPSIVLAAVITGSEILELEAPPGVDAIFKKPVSSGILKNFLGITS